MRGQEVFESYPGLSHAPCRGILFQAQLQMVLRAEFGIRVRTPRGMRFRVSLCE